MDILASLESPLHGAINTLERLAVFSKAGTEGRLYYFLPAGKDSRYAL
ncbi:MAG: hypothetical protein ACRD2L_19850 [Terriglobia bacterium]